MDSQTLNAQTVNIENNEISRIITKILKNELSNRLNQDVEVDLAINTFRLFADREANAETDISFACNQDLFGKFKAIIGLTGVPIINMVVFEPLASSWIKGKIKKITNANIEIKLSNLISESANSQICINAKVTAHAKQKEFDNLLIFIKHLTGADFSFFLSSLSISLNNGTIDFSIYANGSVDPKALENIYAKICK